MARVPRAVVDERLGRILERLGFSAEDAAECAGLFAEASEDGVQSHGLDRFPRFVQAVRDGVVDPRARPVPVAAHGALERWDGRRGPGNLNARRAMDRAIQLARGSGVGCVALANTNHWMRGGSYGWQAAEAGVVAICWTNTMPNLPPWGAADPRVGNNPLVIAVPRPGGHVVLDTAMSQFSYGTLATYARRGERLPVPGGFDASGALTDDPGAIEASARPLPIGYWKGSGLALVLDLIAALLSGGLATHEIPPDPARESGLSQVFVALALPDAARAGAMADAIVAHATGGAGTDPSGARVRYPGERARAAREESRRLGVPVDDAVWARIAALDA